MPWDTILRLQVVHEILDLRVSLLWEESPPSHPLENQCTRRKLHGIASSKIWFSIVFRLKRKLSLIPISKMNLPFFAFNIVLLTALCVRAAPRPDSIDPRQGGVCSPEAARSNCPAFDALWTPDKILASCGQYCWPESWKVKRSTWDWDECPVCRDSAGEPLEISLSHL